MSKELRALLNAINAKKTEVRELVASKKLEDKGSKRGVARLAGTV